MEACTEIPKISARKDIAGPDSLQGDLEKMLLKALKVKAKLQWRCQYMGDTRNVGHVLRTSSGTEESKPQREAMCVQCHGVGGMRLEKAS